MYSVTSTVKKKKDKQITNVLSSNMVYLIGFQF